jgi:hypothetical protein
MYVRKSKDSIECIPVTQQVAEELANALSNGINTGIDLAVQDATAPVKPARKSKASKPASDTVKPVKASKPKADKVKPAYALFDNQNAIMSALGEIGTELENIQRRVGGVLRDKTCILAANYAYLQANKEGGWTFEHSKVAEFVKGCMFEKAEDDGILSRSSLYKNIEVAVKLARLLHSNVNRGKFELKRDDKSGDIRVMAPWSFFEPTVKVGGKDMKNTETRLLEVPSWAIEAQYARAFDDAALNSYGRIMPLERVARAEGNTKSLDDASMPEVLARLASLSAALPEDAKLKGELKDAALDSVAKLTKLAGVDTSTSAKSELADVVEVEIKDATFTNLLQAVRERLPASDKEWARCSTEERELMSIIWERIGDVANPVKLAV